MGPTNFRASGNLLALGSHGPGIVGPRKVSEEQIIE